MYSPEVQSKIAQARMKMLAGTITDEEYQEVILLMREGRKSALQATTAAKRKKAVMSIPDANALLDGLS